MRIILTAIILALWPITAYADPVSIVTIIASAAIAASPMVVSGTAFAWGVFALNAAVGFASLGANLLFGQQQSAPVSSNMAGRTINIRQSVSARQTIYGGARTGGVLIFADRTKKADIDGDGNSDEESYLHLVYAMAAHEIDGFEEFYINKTKVNLDSNGIVTNTTKFKGRVKIQVKTGAPGQTAFADLVAESEKWTNKHVGTGCALMYVKLHVVPDLLKSQFPPNFSAKIRGKKVRNLITGQTAFSRNAVWCLYDYIRSLGERLDRIDQSSVIAAAQISNEDVTRKDTKVIKRYTCNGVVSADGTPKDILTSMTTTFAGAICWTGGKWAFRAGAWEEPVAYFDESNLRGAIKIVPRISRRDGVNGMKGTFVGEETDWQPDTYPAVTSNYFVNIDGGEERFGTLALPFTDNSAEAQRLAKIALYRQREQISVETSLDLTALAITTGDVIGLSLKSTRWVRKAFEVVKWKFVHSADDDTPTMRCDVVLREISPQVFKWNAEERSFERNNTNLPDASESPAPTISLDSELRIINENVVAVLLIQLNGQNSASGENEVQYRPTGATRWRSVGKQATRYFEVPHVKKDGTKYDVRARSQSAFGVWSDWTTRAGYAISAVTDAPGVVEGFDVEMNDDSLFFTWTPVSDLDLSHYIIKWTPKLVGATWRNSTTVGRKISRPATSASAPARDGSYLIRAVDKDGNLSPEPAICTVTNTRLFNRNVVESRVEHPVFTGNKTDVVVNGSPTGIVLRDTTDPLTGYYYFSSWVDLGAVYGVSIRSVIDVQRHEYNGTLFDSVPGLFDAQPGLFENSDMSDIEAWVEISTRDDAADTWSAWRELRSGTYRARHFRLRAVLRTETAHASPKITELKAVIDVPDRIESNSDVTSNAGSTLRVNFTPPFRELRGISIRGDDLNPGDYHRITDKGPDGFNIRFYNSSGTGISRTFDWFAKGFGRRAT